MSQTRKEAAESAVEAMRLDHAPKGVVVPEFTQVDEFTTFKAEYGMVGNDLVMHFFATPEIEKSPKGREYWLRLFPTCLDPVAQHHFEATAPRLQAKYTELVNSWWLQAQGYSHLLDVDAYVSDFLTKLDESLEALNVL